MQRMAYGFLGLKPHEFWELTPKEFVLMTRGYKEYDDTLWRKVAQLASWVTAPHLKNPISPDKLLKPQENNKSRKKTTPEETSNVLAELEDDVKVI